MAKTVDYRSCIEAIYGIYGLDTSGTLARWVILVAVICAPLGQAQTYTVLPVLPAGAAASLGGARSNITDYPTPTGGSGPTEIAAGPDGALWFTEQSSKRLGASPLPGS